MPKTNNVQIDRTEEEKLVGNSDPSKTIKCSQIKNRELERSSNFQRSDHLKKQKWNFPKKQIYGSNKNINFPPIGELITFNGTKHYTTNNFKG